MLNFVAAKLSFKLHRQMYSRKVFANFANFCHGLQKSSMPYLLYSQKSFVENFLTAGSSPTRLETSELLQTITKPNDKIQLWTFLFTSN